VAVCNLCCNTRGLLHLLVRLSTPKTATVRSSHTLISTASKIQSAVTHINTVKILTVFKTSNILILKESLRSTGYGLDGPGFES